MTSRRVMEGLKTYLTGAGMALTGLTFNTVEESEDKAYPLGVVEETGTSERGDGGVVMRGIYDLTVACHLYTDPERTTDADHQTAMDEFYSALGNTTAITAALDGETSLRCYDVRGIEQITGPEDGRRKTTVTLLVTAAEI
tara:strand:- start:972 stop:1394 length:423 start_codon:yes stop_codon:yes gene_type:complete